MTLTPPLFPVPWRDQRTLRQLPLPGMTTPASGSRARNDMNSSRSSSDHIPSASETNVGVSMTVKIKLVYGRDGPKASAALGLNHADRSDQHQSNCHPPSALLPLSLICHWNHARPFGFAMNKSNFRGDGNLLLLGTARWQP